MSHRRNEKNVRATTGRCPECGKMLRIGTKMIITGTVSNITPLKRGINMDYVKECVNPLCSWEAIDGKATDNIEDDVYEPTDDLQTDEDSQAD